MDNLKATNPRKEFNSALESSPWHKISKIILCIIQSLSSHVDRIFTIPDYHSSLLACMPIQIKRLRAKS